MTTTNIIGFILIAISIVVQVGSFVVRWFCIPSEPYFSEKTNCMVTYAEIKDMRHRCNVVTVIGVVLMAVGIVLAVLLFTY